MTAIGRLRSAQLTEVCRVFLKRRGSEPQPLKQWEKRYDPWAIKAPLPPNCDDLTRPLQARSDGSYSFSRTINFRAAAHFFNRAQVLWVSGVNASSAGMVAMSL